MDLQIWQRRGLLAAVGLLAFLIATWTLISSFQWIGRSFPGFILYGNLTVAPDFLPQWSGTKEGLKFLDRVVAVQGEPIPHPSALYASVQNYPPGAPFVYTVERGAEALQLTIPSMRFSFHEWLLSFGIYLLTGVGFLAIGFAPFYLRSPSPAAAPLFFMVSTIFFWFTTTFDFMTAQVLPKEVRIFAFALTPSAGIHLGMSLTRGRADNKRHRPHLIFIYGLSILIGVFYSASFYGSAELWHLALRLGYGYSWVAALIFLALLWAALRRPISDLERSRLRVVMVGAVLGFFLPTLGTVLASFLSWQVPYNLLLIPAAIFPLSVAYALLKYSLFDLDFVLKVGLTRGALTGALLLIYVLVVSLLGVSVGIYEKGPLVPLLFSVLVVLAFNPLLRWIEGVVDHYLYPKDYDPIQLQSEVGVLLRSLSRPQAAAENFLKLVRDHVGVETASLFFGSYEQDHYLGVCLNGGASGAKELPRDLGAIWTQCLGARRKGISKEEVETDPAYQQTGTELLRHFARLEAELLIPITFHEKILGFVSFGKRRSGKRYGGDDFRLLCSLTDQLALAIENGMLFEGSEKAKESYRLLYDQSQIMNRRLIETDRLKKQFVANISHEIRTPISTILGYTEVLLDAAFRGDTRAMLERIVTNGQELTQLMDSLLDFSRMEAGTLTTSLQRISLREVLQVLEIMTRRLIKERPVRFRVEVQAPVDIIETDAKKLQQILTQLLTNALKFTERGEVAIGVRSVRENGYPFIAIVVTDTGIGISKQDQEIIFEEFRQLDGSSTRRYGGTGLGLSLCRKLAGSLGGRIEVESEIGRGSTFSLFLPLEGSRRDAVSELQAV